MAEIPIPLVNQDLETSDPSGSLVMIVLLIAGFSVLTMASSIGSFVGARLNQGLASVLGFNPATGQSGGDNGVDIL